MLIDPKRFLFIYVVDRDLGFAPNPFHSYCTLATCKARLRNSARVNDWVMGVGGSRLKAPGRCIYLMKVTELTDFNNYWNDDRFRIKKPVRNGSLAMMVGDNVYHRESDQENWTQEDSHHSNPDGTTHTGNLKTDTASSKVLISTYFYYFGCKAPVFDLEDIGYKNGRNYSKKPLKISNVASMVSDIDSLYERDRNTVIADPFNFNIAAKRVDQKTGVMK